MTSDITQEGLFKPAEQELENARLARSRGNEGMARVCARRAIGKALKSLQLSTQPPLAAIHGFAQTPGLPETIRQACSNLQLKVDETFNLADDVDLIASAELILEYLINLYG